MKQTVNKHDFKDAFRIMGRMDQFSWNGLDALFDYLEQLEDDCGEEIELDVIALCCDFAEYPSAIDAAEECGFKPDENMEYDDKEDQANEWLRDRTTVIEVDGTYSVIIQSF